MDEKHIKITKENEQSIFIRLECENCGATLEVVDKGHVICRRCGQKYLVDDAKGRLVLDVNVSYDTGMAQTREDLNRVLKILAVLAVVVVLIIWGVLAANSNKSDSDDIVTNPSAAPHTTTLPQEEVIEESKVINITKENGLTCVYTEESLAEVSQVIAPEDIDVLCMEGFYDVHYLDGMEACVNLKELYVDANLEYTELPLDMKLISSNTSLEKLTLKAGNKEYLNLESMGNLTNLKEFYLEWITLEDCTFLDKLVNLERLSMKAPDYFDAGFLKKMPNLKALHLSGGGYLTAEDIANIPDIEELTIKIDSAAALEAIAGLSKLRMLDLTINDDLEEKWKVNITDISVLAQLPALESLTIYGSAFTSVEVVFAMPTLRKLNIGFFEVDPKKLQVNETMEKVVFMSGLPKKYDTREYISDKVFLEIFPNVTVLRVE